ncbi:integral membrane [Lecanosticta acicola]|uniref:Integral membrane n=1 Tax=Lecanosticta acicola TaxID=111012 RepID=A0AAI8Z699_9PEZI|nr:integral membrane [Lecanosticta acicola]
MRPSFSALLALLHLACAANLEEETQAGIDPNAKASYFVLHGYVFALNVVENGDVYFHMNAPSSHSWMGIGFGSSMTNTRMIVSYLAEDGHTLINSCRMAHGHSEPVHDPDCIIEGVSNDTYAPYHNSLSPDGILISHAVCRNCSTWANGFIDTKSTAAPFIYALGPNVTLKSDSPTADLRVHELYSGFTLDMTKATNYSGWYGRVPAPQDPGLQTGQGFWAFANYFSSSAYGTGSLADWAPAAHAAFMCVAFLFIFPLGAISLRLVRRARFHAMLQMIGLVFVLIGFGLGIYAAKLYNKSKHFNSVHQIIGLVVFAGLFLQIGLGLSHHLIFMRSGTPTPLGKTHRFLGIFIMVLAVVNGGLGFDFANNPSTAYAAVVAVMAVLFGALTFWVWTYNRKHVYKPEKTKFVETYHDQEPQGEYEMQQAPFASMGHVQTPRTPFFGQPKWDDDPENYRDHLTRNNTAYNTGGQESLYTDTPASESKENPFRTKWEAVPLR